MSIARIFRRPQVPPLGGVTVEHFWGYYLGENIIEM
jgi:hypothetical protein